MADLEDKRLKFDKNYIYNQFFDPNPEEGTLKEWRAKETSTEVVQIQQEVIYKVMLYRPYKQTKMQAFNVLGSQTLDELEDCIY